MTAQDELLARANPHNLIDNPAAIDYAYDDNRDKKVGAVDQLIARANHTNFTNALNLIAGSGCHGKVGPDCCCCYCAIACGCKKAASRMGATGMASGIISIQRGGVGSAPSLKGDVR